MNRTCLILVLLFAATIVYGQRTILWEVADTATGKRSYIAGTFHQFGNSFADSIPRLKEAILSAELAIFESLEDGRGLAEAINERQPSAAIKKGLKKKDFRAVKELSKNWEVDVYKLEPVELALLLRQEFIKVKCGTVQPHDTWDNLDNYLIHIAKTHNKELLGLETDSMQLDILKNIYGNTGWENEAGPVSFWIEKLSAKKRNEEDCLLVDKYRRLAPDYEFSVECEDDILVKKRNDQWMEILPGLLSAKNCFVAVGLSHLMHTCGLLEQLKRSGFSVKPVRIDRFGE